MILTWQVHSVLVYCVYLFSDICVCNHDSEVHLFVDSCAHQKSSEMYQETELTHRCPTLYETKTMFIAYGRANISRLSHGDNEMRLLESYAMCA